jgi:hypothetical protein
MTDLYKRTCDRIDALRDAGLEPDRVVVSANAWKDVKDRADVREGEGYAGSDETLVNGVPASWTQMVSGVEIIHEVDE